MRTDNSVPCTASGEEESWIEVTDADEKLMLAGIEAADNVVEIAVASTAYFEAKAKEADKILAMELKRYNKVSNKLAPQASPSLAAKIGRTGIFKKVGKFVGE